MPEGPEVKNLAEQLHTDLRGKTLIGITVLAGKYATKKEMENFNSFNDALPLKIKSVNAKGKLLWFEFTEKWYMFNGLGMVGRWTTEKGKNNIKFKFDELTYYYNDYRNFGNIYFVKGEDNLEKKLNCLGPDLLSDKISSKKFIEILRKHNKKTLRVVLSEQKIFSGIGNYISSDVLYLSKLDPFKKISDRSDALLENLFKVIRKYMKDSYKNKAEYSEKRNVFEFVVYMQDVDPYGNKVVRVKDKKGRMVHMVPSLQKN